MPLTPPNPDIITDEEFHASGRTGQARNFPLSELGFRWLCDWNGVAPERVPRTWWFASNAHQQKWIEQRGAIEFLEGVLNK